MKTVYAAIAGAWALAIAAQATGSAHALHHDALIEHGPALPLALLLFLVAWQAMTAAMMLPSSLPLVRMYAARVKEPRSLAAFLGGYALVWSGFGALAFLGDTAIHRTVDAWPWLRAHDWLILAGTFGLAGAFQFSSLKDACLRTCRHPGAYLLKHYRPGPAGGFRLGAGHGVFCVGCCWALMLVMFAAGVASLVWMGALTALMVVEKTGRSGRRFVPLTGATFLLLAALAATPALAAAPRNVVRVGGSTTADCRAPAPPCTLGHALASLQDGDDVVLDGTSPLFWDAGSITIGTRAANPGLHGPLTTNHHKGAVMSTTASRLDLDALTRAIEARDAARVQGP